MARLGECSIEHIQRCLQIDQPAEPHAGDADDGSTVARVTEQHAPGYQMEHRCGVRPIPETSGTTRIEDQSGADPLGCSHLEETNFEAGQTCALSCHPPMGEDVNHHSDLDGWSTPGTSQFPEYRGATSCCHLCLRVMGSSDRWQLCHCTCLWVAVSSGWVQLCSC